MLSWRAGSMPIKLPAGLRVGSKERWTRPSKLMREFIFISTPASCNCHLELCRGVQTAASTTTTRLLATASLPLPSASWKWMNTNRFANEEDMRADLQRSERRPPSVKRYARGARAACCLLLRLLLLLAFKPTLAQSLTYPTTVAHNNSLYRKFVAERRKTRVCMIG